MSVEQNIRSSAEVSSGILPDQRSKFDWEIQNQMQSWHGQRKFTFGYTVAGGAQKAEASTQPSNTMLEGGIYVFFSPGARSKRTSGEGLIR